jgi:probable HAF family extracellular repeat protein
MSFRFTPIDDPNAFNAQGDNGTHVLGIGSKTGVLIGYYDKANGSTAGFADFLGNYGSLAGPPGATSYLTTGINNHGNYVGAKMGVGTADGFVNFSGTFVTIDDPNAANATLPFGINDTGRIVGYYADATQTIRAFTYFNGVFSDLNLPGAINGSAAIGINTSGEITGYYVDADAIAHGFLDINGSFTTLDVPFAASTIATGINDSGQIVGQYYDGNNDVHGFLYSNGHYTTFDDPRAQVGQTTPWGITNSGVIVGDYSDPSGVSHGFVASRATPHDLYGSGTASVLWRSGSGLATWNMNGSSIFSSGTVSYQGQVLNPDASWSVAGTADFNADGQADVLWHQSGGPLALWQMNGATVKTSSYVTYNGGTIAPDASWTVAGVADFTADSEADILWRQSSGALAMWSMDGSTVTSSSTVTYNGSAIAPDASWTVAGIADFNGDGYADVLWRQSSGALALWDMKGAQVMSSAIVTSNGSAIAPDASWSVAGIGDLNNDGRADMLWRQSSGALALWQMNDASVAGSNLITWQGNAITPDASWKVVEIGDFDGDGKSDILWRNDSGAMAEWLMNGSQVTASVTPSSQGNPVSPGAGWNVQGNPTMFA